MIRLHYANRLEGLIAPLAASIAAQQRERPLERVTIVVPNRVVEHFLKHRVSEAIGIAANLDFPFLRRFLADVIHKAEPQVRILDVEEMELVLFESLRATLADSSRDFHALRGYIDVGQATEADKEVRTFRLAAEVARLFREYSISRRPMLQSWMREGDASGDEISENEKWQRSLWISTFDANGRLRAHLSGSSQNDWKLLPEAFEGVSASALKAALPKTMHVFGLAYAGPEYVRIFSRIGSLTQLNLYALNPCLEFWEDVGHLSQSERASWVRRHTKIGSNLDQFDDPFDLHEDIDTPALRLWARPGREYLRMLNELTECDFEAHFTHHDQSEGSTLLGSVQEDILNRAPERMSNADPLENDGSIRFLACPSIAREAEIVANEIWAVLEHDARGAGAIRFHQIGVIVPDASYQEYLPHIENAFARLHQLPMNVVNRGSSNGSIVPEAIALLLRLPLGRFSRDDLLHLLNHPSIRGAEAEFDSEQASRWCADLGIFFGSDADDLADTYIPRDTYHWDQGLRRLALGVFMYTERGEEPRFYRSPEFIQYLPCGTSQDEGPAAAAFIKKARQLLCDASEIRSHRWTFAQWSRLLGDLILAHIHVDDPADERARERCLEAVEAIGSYDLKSAPVSYQVVHELVAARIAEMESQLAQFTEHGIVVGPLSALRSIPFRTIFMLGMNEGSFPARERHDPMDLRLARRRAGDVTPTERDRYLFLETLLAARERICLSYIARDPKTGADLEPSSVVRELQLIIRSYVGISALSALTTEHPLSRYDSRYFSDMLPETSPVGSALSSYDTDARRGAMMAALRAQLTRDCGHLPLPGRDEPIYERLNKSSQEELRPLLGITRLPSMPKSHTDQAEMSLSLSALRKFLECPLQGAARYALGMFEDDEDLEQWDDEPIAQSTLDRTNLLRDVFWKARGDRDRLIGEYANAFRISQLAGQAPVGPFEEAAKRTDREKMLQWIEQAQSAGGGSLEGWHQLRMGRGDELSRADRIISELSIPVRIGITNGEQQSRIVKLHGNLGFVSPDGRSSLRLVLRDQSKCKDFLAAFLAAVVLAAAKELTGKTFDAIVVGAGKNKYWNETRSLNSPGVQQARDYLSNLLGDLLFSKNHYFFPIEAVEAADKELGSGPEDDVLDVIGDIRDNEYASCSSDYGPIRNARRFEPPSIGEVKRIMIRRFGLIRSVFGKAKG